MSVRACFLLSLLFAACGHPHYEIDTSTPGDPDADDTSEDDSDQDTDASADDTGDDGCAVYDGTIEGTIYVQKYAIDDAGDTRAVDWEDDEAFPYGFIYVAAYEQDESTEAITYFANQAIAEPTTGGDAYSLTIEGAGEEGVRIYAALDEDVDRVIGSWDPIGNHPELVLLCDENTAGGVDVTVMVQVPWTGDDGEGSGSSGSGSSGSGSSGSGGDGSSGSGSDGEGSSGSGSDGGGGVGDTGLGGIDTGIDDPSDTGDTAGDGPTLISGEIRITTSYAGGEAAAMLLDPSGIGPYLTSWIDPDLGSVAGDYEMEIATDYGDMQLVGAWDNNMNGFVEPTDQWGAYVAEPGGEDANPISVLLGESLPEHDIEVPLEAVEISLTPFVTVRGTLTTVDGDGDFSQYGSSSVVYIAALKYRPQADIDVEDLYAGYDVDVFESPAGESLGFELVAPAHGIIYLWAYVDLDGDGVIQEIDEPIAAANEYEGRMSTEDAAIDMDLPIVLQTPGG